MMMTLSGFLMIMIMLTSAPQATDADVGDKVSLSIRGPFAKIFSITDDGLIKVKSLKTLNTSQCHLIVVATDSGSPPRSSSVPVTVQFAPGVLKSFGRSLDELDKFMTNGAIATDVDVNMLLSASSSSAIVLVIVLGVLLATLFIIIITLTVHVLKQRKFPASPGSNSSDSSGSGSASPNHYQQYTGTSRRPATISSLGSKNRVAALPDTGGSFGSQVVPGLGSRGVENPIFNLGSGATTTSNLSSRYFSTFVSSTGAPTGKLGATGSDPDSAIASDSSSSETYKKDDVDQGSRHSSQASPPPPTVTCSGGPTTAGGTASLISVVKWPQVCALFLSLSSFLVLERDELIQISHSHTHPSLFLRNTRGSRITAANRRIPDILRAGCSTGLDPTPGEEAHMARYACGSHVINAAMT